MKSATGQLILITGASSGIGECAAKEFAARGARVVLMARNGAELARVASEISSAGGKADRIALDVGDPKAVAAAAERIKRDVGIPDVLINNAGGGKWRFVDESTIEEAVETITVPYLAAFFVTRAFLSEMLARRSGRIVNVTSLGAVTPWPGATAYIASRFAMVGLHEALVADLRGTGVEPTIAYFAKVQSSFWEHNPGSEERLPRAQRILPTLTAERAAHALVEGVLCGKRTIVAPFAARFVMLFTRLFPRLMRWHVARSGYKRPK